MVRILFPPVESRRTIDSSAGDIHPIKRAITKPCLTGFTVSIKNFREIRQAPWQLCDHGISGMIYYLSLEERNC